MAVFGKTSDGANSTALTVDRIDLSTFSPNYSGVIDTLTVRAWVDSTATTAIGVIYSDSGGAPGDLIAQTDEFTISNTSEDEVTGVFTGTNELTLAAGVNYWVGVFFKDPGASNVNYSRANTAAEVQYKASTYSSGVPASLSGMSSANGPIDCYVSYRPQQAGKMVDLYYNFNDNSMDTAKWGSFGTGVAETSNELQLTTALAGGSKGYYSIQQWDFQQSEASTELVNAGNQALVSLQVYPVLIEVDSNNRLIWQVSGNVIYAQTVIDGSTTNVFSTAYSSTTHKYFKIRERFGITYWEYSTDGENWTIAYQLTTPLDITNVNMQIQIGTYAVEGSTTTAIFDNFNVDYSLNTGAFAPTSTGAVHNQFSNPSSAYILDGAYASSATTGHRQDYGNFNLNVPTGATIVGIEVRLHAKNNAGTSNTIAVDLSYNGGTNWSSSQSTSTLTASLVEYTLGSRSYTYGRTWAASEFTNANFKLRLTLTRTANTAQVDYLTVRVYYTMPARTATVEQVNAIRRRFTIQADALSGNLKAAFAAPGAESTAFSGGYIPGGSNTSITRNTTMAIGQVWNEVSASLGLIRFDTSSLPDNVRIRSVKLKVYGSTSNDAVGGWYVEARQYNFGHKIDDDDWYKTTEIVDDLPLIGVASVDELNYNAESTELISTAVTAENINTDGYTGVMLVSSRLINEIYGDYGGSTAADSVYLYSALSSYPPELVIEYDDETAYTSARDSRTEIRLYDKDGVYIRNLKTVADEYSIAGEINSAGSTFNFTIAQDATVVDEDLIIGALVTVYKYDQVRTDGIKIYEGRISGVKSKSDRIEVSTKARTMEMQRFPFEKVVSTTEFTPAYPTPGTIQTKTLAAATNWCAQSFEAPYENLAYFDFWGYNVTVDDIAIHNVDGSTIGEEYIEPSEVRQLGYDNSTGFVINRVYFDRTVTLTVGQVYFIVFKGTASLGQGTGFYSGGSVFDSSDSGVTWAADTTKDLFIAYYFGNYSTTVSYTDTDPVYVMRDIIDSYQRQGGLVSYDGGSALFTSDNSTADENTNITLTIQNVSILEALRAVLQYAPPDWYFYVDVATNTLYFKKRSDSYDFALLIGENVTDFDIDVNDRELSNVVYFTGGNTGSSNLYVKGVKQGSIDEYGRFATTINDNRVTNSATALKAINKILTEQGNPAIEGTAVLVDVPMNGANGYVIENLTPGNNIALKNIGELGVQVLDSIILDDIWLDYKLYDYSTFVMQVVKSTLKPDVLELTLETPRVEIAKVLNSQTKQLRDQQTVDNPDTPE